MSESTIVPLLESGANDLSVIAGAPEEFDLRALLKGATAVRIAIAFGHESGWKEIESDLRNSAAATIQILLGQSFFRTEPPLLLKIKRLQETRQAPKFEVKLASARATFHPKVWIIDGTNRSECIVGSGNLSGGGLIRNVECALLTRGPAEVKSLREWFDSLWKASQPLAETFDDYRAKYDKIRVARRLIDDQIEAATREQAEKEATWRLKSALKLATEYWLSGDGMAEVEGRKSAIQQMRADLHYPSWEFGVDEWSHFLRIPELGRIRLGHEDLTIAGLPQLKTILKALTAQSSTIAKQVDDLQTIPGIKRNLATKLLAVYNPEKYVVVNGPVERALRAFGYDIELGSRITGKGYAIFLQSLRAFIEEAEAIGLHAAPALDAFFYKYQNA